MIGLKRLEYSIAALFGVGLCSFAGQAQRATVRAEFHVKYVAAGAVYLDGGRGAGLAEGMKLRVKRPPPATASSGEVEAKKPVEVGDLRVSSVAQVSAVCDVLSFTSEIRAGDLAYLDESEVAKAVEQRELSGSRKFPQIITFNEGDPLEDEMRAYVPRPPLPEINRARGMIGFEYGGLASGGPFATHSTQLGMFLRSDVTRINGTHWNLSGYWRGRLDTRSIPGQQTVDDMINRTYHLSLTYDNPDSHWVAGFGRLYLPWASSLNTLDGGYLGRRFGKITTAGIFAGSNPDPTSWDFSPNRRTAGTFVNFTGGSFESLRYTSTFGVAVSSLGWAADRQFVFAENGLFYKNSFSIYQSLQADRPRVPGLTSTSFTGVSRSFVTVHIRPHPRVSFDLNHNYFREIPTFDLALVSTGLVEKLLFQGLSAGARVEVVKHIAVYTTLGRNSKTGDARGSWNQLYGVTMGEIWRTKIRADLRYSKFDSSFGHGTYSMLSLSREFGAGFRGEILYGQQNLLSTYTRNSNYRSLGANFQWYPKGRYYVNGGYTRQRGTIQDYHQWYVGLGYRFDSFKQHRPQALANKIGP